MWEDWPIVVRERARHLQFFITVGLLIPYLKLQPIVMIKGLLMSGWDHLFLVSWTRNCGVYKIHMSYEIKVNSLWAILFQIPSFTIPFLVSLQTLNPFSLGMVNPSEDDDHIILTELKSEDTTPSWLSQQVDKQIYLHLGLHRRDSPFSVSGLYGWNESLAFGGKNLVFLIRKLYCSDEMSLRHCQHL